MIRIDAAFLHEELRSLSRLPDFKLNYGDLQDASVLIDSLPPSAFSEATMLAVNPDVDRPGHIVLQWVRNNPHGYSQPCLTFKSRGLGWFSVELDRITNPQEPVCDIVWQPGNAWMICILEQGVSKTLASLFAAYYSN